MKKEIKCFSTLLHENCQKYQIHFSYLHIFFLLLIPICSKLTRHPHRFCNFLSGESYVLGNFEYQSCAKVNTRGPTELRKFLPLKEFCAFVSLYMYIYRDANCLVLICERLSYLQSFIQLHSGLAVVTRECLCKKMLLRFVSKNIRLCHSSTLYNFVNHFFNYRYVTVQLITPLPPFFHNGSQQNQLYLLSLMSIT